MACCSGSRHVAYSELAHFIWLLPWQTKWKQFPASVWTCNSVCGFKQQGECIIFIIATIILQLDHCVPAQHLYYSVYPFLFIGMSVSEHVSIQQWSVFLPVWLSLDTGHERTHTLTQRETNGRQMYRRSDLGKEIWYHVGGSAKKVSYNVQFFI